jgi:hypothetical protein
MGTEGLLVILAMMTMIVAIVFALLSKAQTDKRRRDANATKSTLAKDKSSTGDPADVKS